MSSAHEQAFLVIEAPNGDVREIVVGRLAVVIGRDESADIRINDKKVSRRHIAFRTEDDVVHVEDLGSVNGIKLNGRRVENSEVLNHGDIVKFDGYQVTLRPVDVGANSVNGGAPDEAIQGDSISEELYAFLEPRMGGGHTPSAIQEPVSVSRKIEPLLIGLNAPLDGERFVLQIGENILGRLEDCDIPILHESISRQHARISLQEGGTKIEDLDSSNGTFVDDQQVRSEELQDGDIVRVGSVKFRLELPSNFARSLDARRNKPVQDKQFSSIAKHSSALIPGLIALAIIIAAVSWFTQTDKPFTVLSQLFDSRDSEVRSEAKTELELIQDSKDVAPDTKPNKPSEIDPSPEETKEAAPNETNAPELKRVYTSTSPFSPRDSDGWPLHLPVVDPSFNFDDFVQKMLTQTEEQIEAEKYTDAKKTLAQLKAKDPVNAVGDKLRSKLSKRLKAVENFKNAKKLESQGKRANALLLYQGLLNDPKFSSQVKLKLEESLDSVIQEELGRAQKQSKERSKWLRAHKRLMLILRLDPTNETARELLWQLEKDMRAKQVRFQTFSQTESKRELTPVPKKSPDELIEQHLGNRELSPAIKHYQQGNYERALRSARRLSGGKSKQSKELISALVKIKKKYERVRTALGNDPSEAWFYLREFNKSEAQILPKEVKSFWRNKLEASIADAYAEQGEAMFVQQRYEEAFTKWDAGAKLRPRHVKIEAGFIKLAVVANTMRTEAELLMQQAKPGACDRWRRITRMTKTATDVHKLARKMANQICN